MISSLHSTVPSGMPDARIQVNVLQNPNSHYPVVNPQAELMTERPITKKPQTKSHKPLQTYR